MERREFLRRIGIGTAAPLLAACTRGVQLLPDLSLRPPGDPRDPDGIWREAAAYARWAPSPHNIQPWLLRIVSPTHAELLYHPDRLLPTLDPTSAFTMMGLTMFAEYLSIAVAPHGLSVQADYLLRP